MLRSLRARLILLVCVAFLPMLAITTRDLVRERRALLSRAYDIAGRRVDAAVTAQRDLIEDGRRYLGAVALLAPVSSGDGETCGRTVERVRRLLDEGWTFERLDARGGADCRSTAGESDVQLVTFPKSSTTVPYRGLTIAGYGFDRVTGTPVVTLQMPLTDTATRVSSRRLSITMRLVWLSALARDLARNPNVVVAILDDDRRILARYPHTGHTGGTAGGNAGGSTAPLSDVFRRMQTERNGTIEGDGADGMPRLWVFRELPSPMGTPVYLVHGVPSAPLHAAANRQALKGLLTLGVTVLIVLGLTSWAAQRFLLRDVRALLDATEAIARGDMSSRTGLVHRDGEIGQLASAFDGMASRLQERQERLAHAQKMESVGQLAGGVAHDFNNLLTAIVANTEAAKEALPAEHSVQVELDQVLHAAQRSGQLTRQLLAFARQHTFATRVLTLDRLLENVSALLVRLIGEHIELRVACDPQLRSTRVDPVQIEQAIINLAVNARDAMPCGGTLTIAVHNLTVLAPHAGADEIDPPGSWVVITVTDSGVGMPPDVLRHVFEPFFTTKPVGQGTGLGLAMVYGTARQHGGHVRITSAVGQGTIVRMLLPVVPDAEPSNETPAFGVSLAGTGRGEETILLVEDEEAVRAVSARLLRARGYEVIEAPDGEIALAMMDGDRLDAIDMLVTDLVMPKVGGVELVELLRQRRPQLPVLLVSGYSATGVPSSLLAAPGTDFLEKPFNARSLVGAVRGVLESVSSSSNVSNVSSSISSSATPGGYNDLTGAAARTQLS